jgi:hypothetical protein
MFMNSTATQQNIIITGSSGLIGSALVERFAGMYHVFALDRKEPKAALPPQAEYVQIDLTSAASVQEVLLRVQEQHSGPIASVIHLAAYYDFSGEPSDLYEQITVRGMERLLRALHHLAVEQFVFSSTMLVHRPTEPGQPIREDAPLEGKAYLRGWDYYNRFTQEANAQARQMFECAITLDLQFAAAYAALSETHRLGWNWIWSPDPQTLEQAFAPAQRAVALDDTLPMAQRALSAAHLSRHLPLGRHEEDAV